MAKIKIAELEQVQTQFDELSDLELETVIGGKWKGWKYVKIAVQVASVLLN